VGDIDIRENENGEVNTMRAESTFPQGKDKVRRSFENQANCPGSLLEFVRENEGDVRKQEPLHFHSNKRGKPSCHGASDK
jgi:hypothetical protein